MYERSLPAAHSAFICVEHTYQGPFSYSIYNLIRSDSKELKALKTHFTEVLDKFVEKFGEVPKGGRRGFLY